MSTRPGGNRVVRAAGGVVWRRDGEGTRIAVVGRPRYGDWTLPKGKLEPGEPVLAAAVREVREETGIDAVPQVRLPSIQYLTGIPGVEKSVDFWSMRILADHGREPDDEIAEVRWTPVPDAHSVLTYAHDRGVVAAFAALPPIDREVLLVRHAQAVSPEQWHGPDEARPLDEAGRRQAEQLTTLLRLFSPTRVVSANRLRCKQTVVPLGMPVEVDPRLDEWAPEGSAGARRAVLDSAGRPGVTVVCTQGTVIPALLAHLRPANAAVVEDYQTPKGSGWLLAFSGDQLVATDRLSPE